MIECPKCHGKMDLVRYGKEMKVDRCARCGGLWFDTGEVEALSGKWMSEALDSGNPEVGEWLDSRSEIDCPRCQQRMLVHTQTLEPGVRYEECKQHGLFFDAGEFTATQYKTLLEKLKTFAPR